MKKKLLISTIICVSAIMLIGCGNNISVDNTVNDTNLSSTSEEVIESKDLLKELKVVYMGGLYARSEVNDMMLALFKSSGTPIVVITELGKLYYGEYVTEDATLADGTKYTKITVEGKTYGYYFDGDVKELNGGILVDQEGNKYEAKTLDESVAIDMAKRTVVGK